MTMPPRKPPRPLPGHSSHARPGGSATPLPPQDQPQQPRAEQTNRGSNQGSSPQRPPVIPPQRKSVKPAAHPHDPTGMGAVNKTQLMPQGTPPQYQQGQPQYQYPQPQGSPPRRPVRRKPRRRGRKVFTVLLVLALLWPVALLTWANTKIQHVDALSDAASGDYRTYLLAGSDSRGDGYFKNDTTEGERADSIMLLTVPRSGNVSLVSIPRDTYVQVPGHGGNKINASYSLGGPGLLVETVESFTGMKVDHYAEIGMGGVAGIVDALGTVNLCSDLTVDDPKSKLTWTPGCHDVDGETALAFGRMRYQDPRGDLGRAERQRQIIQAVTKGMLRPSTLLPNRQVSLVDAGTKSIALDEKSNIFTLGKLALAFRKATGDDGVRGTPPVSSTNYQPGGVGSAVLVTDEDASWFFQQVAEGSITEADS